MSNNLQNRIIILVSVIFVIVLVAVIGFGYLKQQQQTTETQEEVSEQSPRGFEFVTSPADSVEKNNATIRILHAPELVKQGEVFNFAWAVKRVGDVEETTKTGVYYDWASHAGKLGTEVTPEQAGYPALTEDFLEKSHPLPQSFTIDFTAEQSGDLFIRGYALINGDHYWTEEQKVEVR